MSKQREGQEVQESPLLLGISVILALCVDLFAFSEPFAVAIMGMALVPLWIVNALNYALVSYISDLVRRKILLSLLISILLQCALVLIAAILKLILGGGTIVSCADSCGQMEFFAFVGVSLPIFQFCFIGGYIALIRNLVREMKNRK